MKGENGCDARGRPGSHSPDHMVGINSNETWVSFAAWYRALRWPHSYLCCACQGAQPEFSHEEALDKSSLGSE